MTRILAVGYRAGAFLPGQPTVHGFPGTVTRDDLDRLVDLVRGDAGDHHNVIAIHPAWHPDPSLRRLQTIRAAVGSPRLLLHASPLPPLAGSVLCALAATIAPHVASPGILVAGLPWLELHLLPLARLRSVARLSDPTPSLGQHVASWWPGSAFGVSWWPQPGVRTLRKRDGSIPLPPPEGWAYLPLDMLAVSGHAGGDTWVRDEIAARVNAREVRYVDAEPLAGRFWGTSPRPEAVAYPSSLPGLVSGVGYRQGSGACRWCGEHVHAARCPFCGTESRTTREAA